jgi:lysophospholipase L1-like esterase
MRAKSIIAVAAIAGLIFSLGTAVGRYELFSFKFVRASHEDFRPHLSYRLQASLFEAFPGQADTVMLGDSITALARWNELFPGKGIANRGIGGDTVEGIRARLGAVIKMNPHKVFVMAGINDLLAGSSAEQVFPIYVDTLRALRSAGPQVFVQSTLSTGAKIMPFVNSESRKLNDGLQKFCSDKQVCTFIDLNARLAPNGYLAFTLDGVHLTPAGYAIWRDEIAPAMARPNSGV